MKRISFYFHTKNLKEGHGSRGKKMSNVLKKQKSLINRKRLKHGKGDHNQHQVNFKNLIRKLALKCKIEKRLSTNDQKMNKKTKLTASRNRTKRQSLINPRNETRIKFVHNNLEKYLFRINKKPKKKKEYKQHTMNIFKNKLIIKYLKNNML